LLGFLVLIPHAVGVEAKQKKTEREREALMMMIWMRGGRGADD
jgi:hypothetical protein